MWSSKKQLTSGTSRHVLDKPTQFFDVTLTGSFHEVRIPSVNNLASHVQKTDMSNCCSHETLFTEGSCGCKRRDAVNYALNSGVGKTPPSHPTAASRLVPARINTLVHASGFSGQISIFAQSSRPSSPILSMCYALLDDFFNFVHSSQSSWPLLSKHRGVLNELLMTDENRRLDEAPPNGIHHDLRFRVAQQWIRPEILGLCIARNLQSRHFGNSNYPWTSMVLHPQVSNSKMSDFSQSDSMKTSRLLR